MIILYKRTTAASEQETVSRAKTKRMHNTLNGPNGINSNFFFFVLISSLQFELYS